MRATGELISKDTGNIKIVGTFQDITEAKLLELQRVQSEIDHRNTLVREVHHRIKNNLQGVSGILSLFANKNPDYAEPFNEANSQLQSVASVYGLQGETPDSSIKLGKLISTISSNISRIWQTNIQTTFEENSNKYFVSTTEGVPIALILNECMTNAAKHQTHDHSMKIHFSSKQNKPESASTKDSAIITIQNQGNHFDTNVQKHIQLNSGLALISSLVPKSGANINWNIEGDIISVELGLTYPVIYQS